MHFIRAGKVLTEDDLPAVARSYLDSGIATVDDMGHQSAIGPRARDLLSGAGLRVRTAVCALRKKGGYGSFLGQGIRDRDDIAPAIREIVDAGADFIKIIGSGIVDITGAGGVTAGGFSSDELAVICGEARQGGLAVACHANGDASIRDAVRAGVASIEHGFFISRETLHMMVEAKTAWVPTVYALSRLVPALSGWQREYAERVVEAHLASIAYAASIGVRLRAGTDSGSPGVEHGSSFVGELGLFRKAGLSLGQILSAACMEEEETKQGSYLLVGEDFLETPRVEEIYLCGRRYAAGEMG